MSVRYLFISLSGGARLAWRGGRARHNGEVQNPTTSASWQKLLELPRKSWWARLPFGVRMTAGTSALLLVIGGGVTGIVAWAEDAPTVNTAGPDEVAVPAAPGGIGAGATAPEDPPPATPTRAPGLVTDIDPVPMGGGLAMGLDPATVAPTPKVTRTPETPKPKISGTGVSTAASPPKRTEPPKRAERPKPADRPTPAARPARPAPAAPVITTRTEVETHSIPFRTRLVRDPALPRGTKDVQAEGAAGVRSLRYLITLTDGRRTGRHLLGVTVTKRPEPRLVVIGTGREADPDTDDEDDPWDCGSVGNDLCVPFGRSSAMCEESDEPDEGGSGAGMIVLGDSVIDDEDLGLPDGYNWAC